MKKLQGFTLVELAVGIVVVSTSVGVMMSVFKEWDGKQAAESLGSSLDPVSKAAQAYINQNAMALQNTSPVIAGVTNPLSPTVSELQTQGLLSSGYRQGSNLLNANALVRIGKTPVGCVSPNCNINYTVYFDRPWLDDRGLANIKRVSQAAGVLSGGGFSSNLSPNILSAGDGSWTTANPINQSGVLASFGSTSGNSGNIGCASFTGSSALIGTTAVPCNTVINGTTQVVSGTNPQLDIMNAGNGPAGIRLRDAGGWDVQLRTNRNSGNSLELLDGSGNVQSSWNGGNYTAKGNISANDGKFNTFLSGNNQVVRLGSASGQNMHIQNMGGQLRLLNHWSSDLFSVDQWGTLRANRGEFSTSRGWGVQPNFNSGWSMVTRNAGSLNNAPQNSAGSVHINDAYIRSVGRWLSDVANPTPPTLETRTWRACNDGVWCGIYDSNLCFRQLQNSGLSRQGWVVSGTDYCSEDSRFCTVEGLRCYAVRVSR